MVYRVARVNRWPRLFNLLVYRLVNLQILSILDQYPMKQMPITQRLSSLISWVLVVDLGLVLLSLGWFLVAVLGRSMNLDLGLDLWYSLWNPLILPALSVLMAGAIASGIVGWVGRWLEARSAD